ncbi:MAG TPA: SPW repeat protein [Roseomonas sp.]|nr:SPW repeat protein [Roseomonas sp.]
MNISIRSKDKPIEIVNLVAAACLFLAPWGFGFTSDWPAAWSAWLAAGMLAVYAVTSWRSSSGRNAWTAGGEATIGIWAICAPWVGHFSTNQPAMWSHVMVGAAVLLAAALDLIWPHMHGSRMA